jgi:hypothetical protein
MAIHNKSITGGNGINYTKEVDGSGDYAALANNTYFKDLSDGIIRWKNLNGTIIKAFDDSNNFDILFVEVESVTQTYQEAFTISNIIKSSEVDTLTISINGGSFAAPVLPLSVTVGMKIKYQISYQSGQDQASIAIIATK